MHTPSTFNPTRPGGLTARFRPLALLLLSTWLLTTSARAQFCPNGTTVAGGNGRGSAPNQLSQPSDVFVDGAGNLYVADNFNDRIQRWAPGASQGTTVAGGNGFGSAPNQFRYATGVSVDGAGNVYVADASNDRIQRWAPGASQGTTVAGGNGFGSAPNQFRYATGVSVDGAGNVYVADASNDRIQRWAPGASQGITVAGGNSRGAAPNQLSSPEGVFVDGAGNVYVADAGNDRIQRWAPGASQGTTVAGGNGNGSAPNQLDRPYGVYVDGAGNLYVADTENSRIQRWAPGATQGTTVAGGNGRGAASNQLSNPEGVFVDGAGNLYVADRFNNRIQRWAPGASQGTTVAGVNGRGAAPNQLSSPEGVFVDGAGNLYVADRGNDRIQRFAPGAAVITQQPAASASACAGSTVTASVTATGTGPLTYQWFKGEVSLGTAQQQATLTLTAVTAQDTGTYRVVVTGFCNSVTSQNFVLTVGSASFTVTPPAAVCAGTAVNLSSTVSAASPAGGTFSYFDSQVAAQANTNPLASSTVSPSGTKTYFIRYQTSGACFTVQSVLVTVNPQPTFTVTAPPAVCAGTAVNLSGTVSGADPAGGTFTYFASQSDAQAGTNPLASSTVSPGGTTTYYVRYQSGECFVVKEVVVTVNPTPTAPNLPAQTTVQQGAPSVVLSASNCTGTLTWTGPGGSTGMGPITVPTAVAGSFTYQVKCVVNGCESPITTATVTVEATCFTIQVLKSEKYLTATSTTIQQFGASGGANQVFQLQSVGPDLFSITSRANNLSWTGSAANRTLVSQQAYTGAPAQQWRLTPKESGTVQLSTAAQPELVGDIRGGSTDNGGEFQVYQIHNGPNQRYRFTATTCPAPTCTPPPAPTITASRPSPVMQNSGPVTLTIGGCSGTVNWTGPTGTSGSGTTIQVLTNQPGSFTYTATCTLNGCLSAQTTATVTVQAPPTPTGVQPGCYTLQVQKSGKLLQAQSGSIAQYGANGQVNQIFQLESVGTDLFSITSRSNGLSWTGSAANRTLVAQSAYSGASTQQWRVEAWGDGSYKLRTLAGPDLLVDIRGGQTTDGGEIQVYQAHGGPNQRYRLEAVSCPASATRLAAPESGADLPGLRVTVKGNPVRGEAVTVEISGVAGESLRVTLSDLHGRTVRQQRLERAGATEQVTLDLGQAQGVLLLRVATPTQSRTVKVVKAE
jgi:sugar lactone lactonase YvrE